MEQLSILWAFNYHTCSYKMDDFIKYNISHLIHLTMVELDIIKLM